jgi:hypothetical protein
MSQRTALLPVVAAAVLATCALAWFLVPRAGM